jgi:hypothetical protein
MLALALAACGDREPKGQGMWHLLGEGPTDWVETGEATLFGGQAALDKFRTDFPGTWDFEVDARIRTLRQISGTSTETFAIASADDAIAAALRIVRSNQPLFRQVWVVDGHAHAGDVWTVQLRQELNGVPVVRSHLGVTFNHGRLVLIQSRAFVVEGMSTASKVTPEQAIARVDNVFEAAGPDSHDDVRLVVLPRRPSGGTSHTVAWEVTSRRRDRDFVSYVDTELGYVIEAHDARAYDAGAYPGAITNDVDARTVGDDILSEPGAYQHAQAGGRTATSNEHGVFRFPSSLRADGAPVAVSAGMRGPYADVRNVRGLSATYAGTIRAGQPVVVSWHDGNSRADERDTFRGTNVTNRFIATIFPDNAWINRPLVANVNHGYTCNAYWDGSTINFFREDSQCNNSGRIFDVIAHEWGHGLDQNAPGGVQDRALGEFIGDLVSFVQTRDAKLGPGFFVKGGAVRDLEDPAFYCYDPKRTEVHDAGQFLGVIVWDIFKDLRALGIDGEDLKRRMILPIAIGQTRSQWYSAMLAVDDDDGNLANGTPHECLIYDRFEEHSCKGARYPGIPAKRPKHCPKK